jgi:hypothetical protein
VLKTMGMSKLRIAALALVSCLALTGSGLLAHRVLADKPSAAPAPAQSDPRKPEQAQLAFQEDLNRLPKNMAQVYAMVKPTADEGKWRQIPWLLDLEEAIKAAKEENRPLFIYLAGGPPLGGC